MVFVTVTVLAFRLHQGAAPTAVPRAARGSGQADLDGRRPVWLPHRSPHRLSHRRHPSEVPSVRGVEEVLPVS